LGAMTVVIRWVVVLTDEVPAVYVVNKTVVVVVYAIPRYLTGVDPQASLQVGMGAFDARIEDGDHHGFRSGDHIPGRGRVDLFQSPLGGKQGVVGDGVYRLLSLGFLELHTGKGGGIRGCNCKIIWFYPLEAGISSQGFCECHHITAMDEVQAPLLSSEYER
jgi:hypothetical protein